MSQESRVYEATTLDTASRQEFSFKDQPIVVLTAPEGSLIDINGQYKVSRGEGKFFTVVKFDGLFEARGLSGSVVPPQEQWGVETVVPGHVVVRELLPETGDIAREAVDTIAAIVNQEPRQWGFLDLARVEAYQAADSRLAEVQLKPDTTTVVAVLLRAGIASAKAAGIDEYFEVEAKRLNEKGNPKSMAVGLDFSEDFLTAVAGKSLYVRERALATGSSIAALVYAAVARGCRPSELVVAATVGSQRGIEILSEQMDELGVPCRFDVGRLNYELSGGEHPYYLVRTEIDEQGNSRVLQEVGDGGDFGAWYCQEKGGNIWSINNEITQDHLGNLAQAGIQLDETMDILGWRIEDTATGRQNIEKLRLYAQVCGWHPDEFLARLFGLINGRRA